MKEEALIIRKYGKIVKYQVYKKVFSSGGSGAVIIPKELVGKEVYIEYKLNNKLKNLK